MSHTSTTHNTCALLPVDATTIGGVGLILNKAFGSSVESAKEWVEKKVKLTNARCIVTNGTAAACAMRVPMGQYFGGKSVPMVGVAGVGVLPEARGKGVGRELMLGLLREMYEEGTPISSLYPATTELYRKVGYEQAGWHFEHAYPVSRIKPRNISDTEIVPFKPELEPGMREAYRAFAQHQEGMLDRGDYIWERVYTPRQGETTGYVIKENGAVNGYVFLRQDHLPHGRHDLAITDMLATTPAASRALITFIAGFGSMAEMLHVRGGAMHPLLTLIDEPRYLQLAFKEYWMLRIVRVKEALAARGYPKGLSCSVTFDVHDAYLPENTGVFKLIINNGSASVEQLAAGVTCDVRADINGLSQLYSGQFAPSHLAMVGRLHANNPGALPALHAAFVGVGGACDFF